MFSTKLACVGIPSLSVSYIHVARNATASGQVLLKSYLDAAHALDKWTIIVSHDVLAPEVECIFNVAKL